MVTPIILYSANTWLANKISEKYYGDIHWVWCSPYFGPGSNPPSSTPSEIYRDLRQATSHGDRHNSKIIANKTGVLKGAIFKRVSNIISDERLTDINSIIESAETIDFRPLLYVIPVCEELIPMMKEAPIRERAHPLSTEYVIEALPRRLFDIIEP